MAKRPPYAARGCGPGGEGLETVRRFLVRQTNKLRPIDDNKECRVNVTMPTIHNMLDLYDIYVCAATATCALDSGLVA
eukprot:3560466-Amphidinium_carterae.1